jgi:glucosamine--fructose-6-phosphate aminotransferase (isomerizing)
LVALYILALFFAEQKRSLPEAEIAALKKELLSIDRKVESVLEKKDLLQRFSAETYMHTDMYYLGRGTDYAVALEGSLKLKELSYIHSESYAGGELKHGPIALISKGTIVMALATQNALKKKMLGNIKEVSSRGAKVLCYVKEADAALFEGSAFAVFTIPEVMDDLSPILAVIPLQLYAYYVAVAKGCDVDKPRNLAKSVTVE